MKTDCEASFGLLVLLVLKNTKNEKYQAFINICYC